MAFHPRKLALVRTVQVLGLLLVAALAAGAVVSADSSSFRASGYPTGPTGTATPTVTPKPTQGPYYGGGGNPAAPRLKLKLLKGSSAKGLKAKVTLSAAGKVKLVARRGKVKVGKKAVAFKRAGSKRAKVKLKRAKLGKSRPVKVTLKGSARAASGKRSNTVKKSKRLR